MDVAAIQQDLPERIDFDHELVTVGKTVPHDAGVGDDPVCVR